MFDKNEELTSIIEPEYLLENQQSQILNGLITATIYAPYSKDLEEATYIGSKDIDDNSVFWLYKVDKRKKEKDELIINATYSLFDDLKAYGIIRDKRPKNASALIGATTLLEGSRWQVGNVTSTHTGTANWYYVSRLEAFWEYLENWRVEFKPRMTFSQGKITGRYIDIVDKLSNDYGKWYEYGDKLVEITAEQASDSLYTAFIGRGKGEEVGEGYGRRIGFEEVVWTTANGKPVNKPLGQDYVEIPSATELYGYSDGKPRMTVVTFENTEDAGQVLQQTYDYALNECRPKLQLKADVLEDGVSELGETCTIVRDDRGIRYKTRVFKLNRDFLKKGKKNVEFGDEIVISTAQRNSNTAKVIKKQEDNVVYWLEGLRQALVDSYFNEDGYNYDLTADNEYDLPAGYYSFDRPIDASPTKVIYMGAGKLMIANSKNPDGQWKWTTAIDGNGANLSAINTGILKAGRIQSALNNSYWDLDTDLFFMKNGTIDSANIIGSSIANPFDYSDGDGVRVVGTNTIGGVYTIDYQYPSNGQYGQLRMDSRRIYSEHRDSSGNLLYSWDIGGAGIDMKTANGSANYSIDGASFQPIKGEKSIINTSNIGRRLQLSSKNGSALGVTTNDLFSERLVVGTYSSGVPFVKVVAPFDVDGNDIENVERMMFRWGKGRLIGLDSGNHLGVFGGTRLRLGVGGELRTLLEIADNLIYAYANIDMGGNSITNQSDIRLKTEVNDTLVDGIKETKKIRMIDFDWDKTNPFNSKKPDGRQFGLEAQHSKFLQTEISGEDHYLRIDVNKQMNLNTLTNKQLIERVESLEERLEKLENLLEK